MGVSDGTQQHNAPAARALILVAAILASAEALSVNFATRGSIGVRNGAATEYCRCSARTATPPARAKVCQTLRAAAVLPDTGAAGGSTDDGTSVSKSGLGFSGMAQNGGNAQSPPQRIQVSDTSGTPFRIGTVTHYNLPINSGAANKGTFTLNLFSVTVDAATATT
ncbi:hypothetical protein U1Q18_051647 [Sarracenia purpurea var. burkii]